MSKGEATFPTRAEVCGDARARMSRLQKAMLTLADQTLSRVWPPHENKRWEVEGLPGRGGVRTLAKWEIVVGTRHEWEKRKLERM